MLVVHGLSQDYSAAMPHFDELLAGYARFRAHGGKEQHTRWQELAVGQSPKVMIIACSDSRSEPADIFDTHPGEIFVVRNVAALVPPFETTPGRHGVSAALEFAENGRASCRERVCQYV